MARSGKIKRAIRVAVLECENLPPNIVRSHGNFTKVFQDWLASGTRKYNSDRRHNEYITIVTSRWRVKDGRYPPDLDYVDAVLITGSFDAAYDNAPWITTLQNFLSGSVHQSPPEYATAATDRHRCLQRPSSRQDIWQLLRTPDRRPGITWSIRSSRRAVECRVGNWSARRETQRELHKAFSQLGKTTYALSISALGPRCAGLCAAWKLVCTRV